MMPKGVEHRGFAAQVFALLCSTPFGIIGILTALVATLLFAAPCKSLFVHLFGSLPHLVLSTQATLLFVWQSPKNQTLNIDASI